MNEAADHRAEEEEELEAPAWNDKNTLPSVVSCEAVRRLLMALFNPFAELQLAIANMIGSAQRVEIAGLVKAPASFSDHGATSLALIQYLSRCPHPQKPGQVWVHQDDIDLFYDLFDRPGYGDILPRLQAYSKRVRLNAFF